MCLLAPSDPAKRHLNPKPAKTEACEMALPTRMKIQMKILLLCHDLTTRLHLAATWTAAGATMLAPAGEETPDCIVVDLGRRDALDEIARLRDLHPAVTIVACFASFNEDAVSAAREAGADDFAARGFVDRRVARLLKLAD